MPNLGKNSIIRASRVTGMRMDMSTGRPATINEATRSVQVVASTEAPAVVFDWDSWRPVTEVLLMSGCQMPATGQVPLLDSHSRYSVSDVIGSFRAMRIEPGAEGMQLVGEAVFSGTDDGDKPWRKMCEGHLTDVSVGYDVIAYTDIKAGETASFDGRQFEGPLRVSTQWRIFELSPCPIGADENAKFRAEPRNHQHKPAPQAGTERKMPKREAAPQGQEPKEESKSLLRKLLRKLRGETDEEQKAREDLEQEEAQKSKRGDGETATDLDDPELLALVAELEEALEGAGEGEGRSDPEADPDDKEGQRKAARAGVRDLVRRAAGDPVARAALAARAERGRITGIQAMCRAHGLDATQEKQLIDSGVTLTSAKAQVYDMLHTRSSSGPGFAVSTGQTEKDKARAAIQDALYLRAGHKVEKPAPGAEELRGFSLREMAREMVVRSGGDTRGDIRAIVGRALTTTDLPILLVETSRRTLMDAYEAAPETWREFAATGTATDFKDSKAVGFEGDVEMQKVPEYGEYSDGRLAENAETYRVETFGRKLVVSRQAIINDDLGALTQVPRLYGEACARLCGDVAYGALLGNVLMGDKKPLFHASHRNLYAGKGGVPTVANLGAVVTGMKRQKDSFGKDITILPKIFLTGVGLEVACDQFFNTQLQGAPVIGTQAQPLVHNPYGGNFFKRVYDRRFDDLSPNAWVLAALNGTVTVFFLGGVESPYIENNENFDTDGFESKVRMDIGAKAMRWVTVAKATA